MWCKWIWVELRDSPWNQGAIRLWSCWKPALRGNWSSWNQRMMCSRPDTDNERRIPGFLPCTHTHVWNVVLWGNAQTFCYTTFLNSALLLTLFKQDGGHLSHLHNVRNPLIHDFNWILFSLLFPDICVYNTTVYKHLALILYIDSQNNTNVGFYEPAVIFKHYSDKDQSRELLHILLFSPTD